MRRRSATAAALLAAALLCAAPARAESDLAVPFPDPLGTFRGVIHDREGRAIGENLVQSLVREGGRVYVRSEARIEGTPGNLLEAELEPFPGAAGLLRPVWQRTLIPERTGQELVETWVDHRAQRARCEEAGAEPREIALADHDHIANVAMTLALRPLAAGDVEAVRFQMLLCEGWRPFVEVEARTESRATDMPVEMRLGFDLGSAVVSVLLAPFLPDIRVWMRPESPNEWIAQRLPFHRGGPIVAIVREGIDPAPFLPH